MTERTSVRQGGLEQSDKCYSQPPHFPARWLGRHENVIVSANKEGWNFFCNSVKTSFPRPQSVFCPNAAPWKPLFPGCCGNFIWHRHQLRGTEGLSLAGHHRNNSNLLAVSQLPKAVDSGESNKSLGKN